MSLQSRTLYLASIVVEVQEKLSVIQEIHSQVKDVKDEYESKITEITEKYDKLKASAISKGRESLKRSLEIAQGDTLNYLTSALNKNIASLLDTIELTANRLIKTTDGISGTVDVELDSVSFSVYPELFSRNTNLIKNSLISPETQIAISTRVSGTAGGDPIVGGVGSQIARITTT